MKQMDTISGSLFEVYTSASQNYKFGRMPEVGQRVVDDLGREFIFVATAVNVAAGQVVAAPAAAAELVDGFTAAPAGSTQITITKSDVTLNKYKDGILVISAGAAGQLPLAIAKNTASGTANAVVITLVNPLPVALVATDDCILIPNRYNGVILGAATYDGVGVAIMASTAATSGLLNYMWVQTKGIGCVKTGTASAITLGVKIILGASGVVEAQSGSGVQREVGYAVPAAAVSNGDNVPAILNFI